MSWPAAMTKRWLPQVSARRTAAEPRAAAMRSNAAPTTGEPPIALQQAEQPRRDEGAVRIGDEGEEGQGRADRHHLRRRPEQHQQQGQNELPPPRGREQPEKGRECVHVGSSRLRPTPSPPYREAMGRGTT